jgi:hypothetical protein
MSLRNGRSKQACFQGKNRRPGIAEEIQDPFGDGPFEYRALDKGFELKSKLLHHEKPVTLTVGQGRKE